MEHYGDKYVEYVARWASNDGTEAPARFVGRYSCPLIINSERRGYYIEPLRVFTANGWLEFVYPPPGRAHFRYPHLLEPYAGASGRNAAGLMSDAHPVESLPEATGTHTATINW